MADINIQIKQRNGLIWDDLFPRTKAENVFESTEKRFVSDAEKTTWNAKQDTLGFTPVPTTRKVAGKALSTDITLAKADVGLSAVDNKSSGTIRSEISSSNITTALGFTPLNAAMKGANSGVAELDAGGKVPASQLPSYVDDILEYAALASFPSVGEDGKIYVAEDTNIIYRWSGSAYVEISASLALGETSSTAYRGDRGKAAYEHSQSAHAPSSAQKNSDITKAEIEAKLTGAISSHSHTSGTPSAHASSHIAGSDVIPDVVAGGNSGLMGGVDKTKLNGIEVGANKYTHPTTAGNKHIPTGGGMGQILKYGGSSGTASWETLDASDIGAAKIAVSATAPVSPASSDFWYEVV